MTTFSSLPSSNLSPPSFNDKNIQCFREGISWPAIFGGVVAAVALEVLFMMLGAGLGFAIYSPITAENPISSLGAGAMIIQGVSAVVSLWFGGWVAGRFTPAPARGSSCLHGFIVWCAVTVAGVLFVSVGAGWAMGDISKIVGGGLSAVGQPAAVMAGEATDMVRDSLKQSSETVSSFTDEALGHRSTGGAANAGIRARREVGMAVARLFNPIQESNFAPNRDELIRILVDQAGMSETDADQAVTNWTSSYDRLKADLSAAKDAAEKKAREAADMAAKALAVLSLVYFTAFALGAVASSCGACHGSKCAVKCESRKDVVVG